MLTTIAALFAAGFLTIFLPCILPLLPIVLGVSVSGGSRLRPLGIVLGMVVSFVGFTFLLQVALSQFVELADILRIGTYQALFLFGVAFTVAGRAWQLPLAALSGLFFWDKGIPAVVAAALFGIAAMAVGGVVAARLQQLGADVQNAARTKLGGSPFLSAFIIGLTLGLVWVPCAGPALGFALALVREQPGFQALLSLSAYAVGTAVPLLIVGYGGQWAVRSVRRLSAYTGVVKRVAGVILILTAVALHSGWLMRFQTYLAVNTGYGTFADRLETSFFNPGPPTAMDASKLSKITRAPELVGLDDWFNGEPLTMAGLKGKVVLIDFWTYSCINCIRTLPYLQGYWEKYKDKPFVLIGVHSPEFTFEKSDDNLKEAIERHGLTYPIVQDNDFATWKAFANRYWPAKYLIDAQGYIRYVHFGEGAYEETDKAIAALLAEAGVALDDYEPMDPAEAGSRQDKSPETYLGARSWPALGNKQGGPVDDEIVDYKAPETLELNKYYLTGHWKLIDGEHQVLTDEAGDISMRFQGAEMNLVLGLDEGAAPVRAEVWIDGEKTKEFVVDRNDLFNLYDGAYGTHDMVLKLNGAGVQAFAFTFGA